MQPHNHQLKNGEEHEDIMLKYRENGFDETRVYDQLYYLFSTSMISRMLSSLLSYCYHALPRNFEAHVLHQLLYLEENILWILQNASSEISRESSDR